jgi:hypothetical protein
MGEQRLPYWLERLIETALLIVVAWWFVYMIFWLLHR